MSIICQRHSSPVTQLAGKHFSSNRDPTGSRERGVTFLLMNVTIQKYWKCLITNVLHKLIALP